MRSLIIGILVFLAWSAGSTWWYACKIKGVCPTPQMEEAWDFGELPSLFVLQGEGGPVWSSDKLILHRVGEVAPLLPEDFPVFASVLEEYLALHPGQSISVLGLADPREGDSPERLAIERAEAFKTTLLEYAPGIAVGSAGGEAQPLVFTTEGVTAGAFLLSFSLTTASSELDDTASSELPVVAPEPVPYPTEIEPAPTPIALEKANPPQPAPTPPVVASPSPLPGQNPGKRSVFFSLAKPEIPSPSSFNQYIDAAIAYVKAHPGKKVRISGHTDDTATPEANLSLGQMRADIIAQRFVERGLGSSDMIVVSMGEKEPVASNATGEGRAQNRRVDIEIR